MAPTDETSKSNTASKAAGSGDADLAQQAATNLENNLSNLESRLDAILAALEANSNLQASPAANAARADESRKAGTTDSKEKPQDGANGDAVEGKKDTA
ncbi:hypothetical protein NW752_004904 [Fusarium irregulare]|uniref:Uncharacterized protein n=1 Tax=Fusarium irregulare TaxID=2494466 RepID=A0A9W8PMM8_9HYPO|nr:hypothetical protein NW766_008099 [Fusarium irregulare]KAJ4019804.1 hypothetical protein NW752_004904 [Fusarium irregulare]